MTNSKILKATVTLLKDNDTKHTQDILAVESPLEIKVKKGNKMLDISVTMRSPGEDKELAIGFLYTEGIINKKEDIIRVFKQQENTIVVEVEKDLDINPTKLERNFVSSASCGLCGKSSLESLADVHSNLDKSTLKISACTLASFPSLLNNKQEIFNLTGGLHAVALFNKEGEIINIKEDVGRHNALDKIIGKAILDGLIPLHNNIILLSGRVGYELVQKTLAASCPILAAIGAPTSLSVSMAKENNLTLIGFLKKEKMNIYSEAQRIIHTTKQ